MGKETRDDDNDHADDLVRRGFWRKVPPPGAAATPSKDKTMAKKKKPQPDKTLSIAPPPEAHERMDPADRSALREAALELQVARQQVELLVEKHGHAVVAARAAERRYEQASGGVVEKYKLVGKDQVDITTGVITREATG